MRVAATSRARVAAAAAEALGPIHARFVPSLFAATRIDTANSVAALGVATIWVLVHNQARTRSGLTAFIGEFDRLLDATFIPANRAAVLEAHGNTHCFADRAVVARRRRMRFKARVLHESAVGAVLLGDRHANVVPCDIAA